MSPKDRLRAKKPPEGDNRWKKCQVKELLKDRAIVDCNGGKVELKLTEELVELFESRMDGKTAWCIKK